MPPIDHGMLQQINLVAKKAKLINSWILVRAFFSHG
jgi:hypothetical protein